MDATERVTVLEARVAELERLVALLIKPHQQMDEPHPCQGVNMRDYGPGYYDNNRNRNR